MAVHSRILLAAMGLQLTASVARADLVIDGSNNYSAAHTYATSTSGYTGYAAASPTTFAFGYNGADVQTGGNQHFLVAYLGGLGASTTTGLNFNTQQPGLPFAATHAIVYRADGGYTRLFNYTGAAWMETATAPSVAESGPFFESSVPMSALGSPTSVNLVSYFLFEGAGFESSYAVMPSDAFTDGYDPNPATFLTITAVPEASAFVFGGLTSGLAVVAARRRRRAFAHVRA